MRPGDGLRPSSRGKKRPRNHEPGVVRVHRFRFGALRRGPADRGDNGEGTEAPLQDRVIRRQALCTVHEDHCLVI